MIVPAKKRTRSSPGKNFAVTVRKKDGVFKFLNIARTPDQIFFSYPAPLTARDWQPHTSIHRDGHVHEKDFERSAMPRTVCKPDASFRGTETIIHIARGPGQWANVTDIFDPKNFVSAFEIDIDDIPESAWTQLQLDLVEPGHTPIVTTGKVIKQGFFQDAVPWIAVTLVDPSA